MSSSGKSHVNFGYVPRPSYNGRSPLVHEAQHNHSFLPIIVQGYTDEALLFRVPIYQSKLHIVDLVMRQVHHATRASSIVDYFARYVVGTAKIVEVSLQES